MTAPGVSVVVPHYNDLAGLDLCLRSLQAQTWPATDFEIIVADNASPCGEAAVAAAIAGRARLVVVAEKGAGPARNGGAAEARGERLAFTDSDCVPQPGWLAAGLAALADHDLVGGAMVVLVQDPDRLTAAEAFEKVFAFDNETYVRAKGFTVTANLFCPKAVFETVGGFKVGVSEDLEWCRRATAAGFSLGYAPDAVVGHPARRTWDELIRKWRRLNLETFGFEVTDRRSRMRWLAKSLAMPLSALAHTPKVLKSPQLKGGGQRLTAVAALWRLRIWRGLDQLRLLVRG